jgi:PAS domain-containing protein
MRCYCGKPTERQTMLAWFRLEPIPDDEPLLQAPICDDCHEVVWNQLWVQKAEWDLGKAQEYLGKRQDILDRKLAEYQDRMAGKVTTDAV